MTHLEKEFQAFIEKKPLTHTLLGLSGGCDSRCLFQLMVEAHIPFEAVFVDHQMSPSETLQGKMLQGVCGEYDIPYHLIKVPVYEKDIENQNRQHRLRIFSNLLQERHLQGVVLAHQKDDHIETILKRVFEGASLDHLCGIQEEVMMEGFPIFRPLLHVSKQEILNWLRYKEIPYFDEIANYDRRFLRNRIRWRMLPQLEAWFGKNIGNNLCKLGEASKALAPLVAEYAAGFIPSGSIVLDLSTRHPHNPLGWSIVVKHFLAQYKLYPSTKAIEQIVFHLQHKEPHKRMRIQKKELWMHRGVLTIQEL